MKPPKKKPKSCTWATKPTWKLGDTPKELDFSKFTDEQIEHAKQALLKKLAENGDTKLFDGAKPDLPNWDDATTSYCQHSFADVIDSAKATVKKFEKLPTPKLKSFADYCKVYHKWSQMHGLLMSGYPVVLGSGFGASNTLQGNIDDTYERMDSEFTANRRRLAEQVTIAALCCCRSIEAYGRFYGLGIYRKQAPSLLEDEA